MGIEMANDDGSDYRIIDLDDAQVADIAHKFHISPEEVWEQWEATKALGPTGVLADMDQMIALVEHAIDEAAADAVNWFGPDRARAMAKYYEASLDATDTDEADIVDLVMKLSITMFKLAEAREQIASLMDSSSRSGRD
jgi:hypothetical protein